MKQTFLEKGKFYHIYNRGRKGENLFRENENYYHFIRLYEKYVNPIAETYAWVLLGNHFHLLIKTSAKETEKPLFRYFSNFFNAYTKSFNKRYNRYGPLFASPFKRIEITSEKYFKNLVHYIHNNPVHHGFCDCIQDYPWSSYDSLISTKPTSLNRDEVIEFFESIDNFIDFHNKKHNTGCIKNFLIE
jgi:REP element-mobilizing transposase RayT